MQLSYYFSSLYLLLLLFYQQNFMTEADVDSIIKKYDKGFYRSRTDLMYTERKKQKDPLIVTFMDNNYTPTKELRESKSYENARVDDLLRHLDEAQKRLAISQRNYADMSRKYEKVKQAYDILSMQLQRERKVRLQQIIDTQNKLEILQSDSDKNEIKLQSKEQTIAILKEKLSQKQEQIANFQIELEQISRKLCETLEMKSKQSIHMLNKQISINQHEANRSLSSYREKYEKSLTALKEENNKFVGDLLEKQKQKKKLLAEIEEVTKKHLDQMKELKSLMSKNEEQYKNWLDEAKKQKLDIIQKYEQQIREYRKQQFHQKLSKTDNLITQAHKNKSAIKELEVKILELQNEIKIYKIQIQTLLRADKQSHLKMNGLQEQLKLIKEQYIRQIGENKNLLASLKGEQQRNENIRKKNHMFEIQIQNMKNNFMEMDAEKKKTQKQLQNLKMDMGKQLKSLINIKKQLNEATNNQLNINSTLTQASTKLHEKISALQSELQETTIELYAERIEKAKLQDQLQETKVHLKRQYELSIQNTRRQLKQQIREKLESKSEEEVQKQQAYLKMFKLQRNYELLKCQVVTVDEMLKMGAKMNKYYQRKSK